MVLSAIDLSPSGAPTGMGVLKTEDRELVERLLAGEEEAFETLFEIYVPRLYRLAVARLRGDADAAEDLVQAALLKALPKLHTFRGEATLLTWLSTICLREISAYYRHRQRRPQALPLSEEIPEVAAALQMLEAGVSGPEHEALCTEIGRLVQATLDRLPPRYADLLEWKYLEGLSVKEMALRLGQGSTAVQSMLARARVAFRDGFAVVGACAGLRSPDLAALGNEVKP